jgi:hypothetical protein
VIHATAQYIVAHDNFAAQHHEQVAAVVGGRVQGLAGRDPARRAIPAQAGLLTVIQHRVSGGFAGQTGHWTLLSRHAPGGWRLRWRLAALLEGSADACLPLDVAQLHG